jgi:hypothetical protein
MLISEDYRAHNAALHETQPDYGAKGSQWAGYVAALVQDDSHASVLDYGAGKGSLARALALDGITTHEYDPAVPGKDAAPAPADLVVCTDVLEHIEPDCLDGVLAHLAALTRRKLFVDVCTRKAIKTLPDGRNAHLSLHDSAWWRDKLAEVFDVVTWTARDDLFFAYGELTPKGVVCETRHKRRKMNPEISAWYDLVRQASAESADAVSRIESIGWFDRVGNHQADLQIVCDLLDDEAEPETLLKDAIRHARKGIFLRVKLTPERPEAWWRDLLTPLLHVGNWDVGGATLCCLGAPRLYVQNVTVVGARPSDERWEQVQTACARITKRITPAAAHGRKAVIACYGPSLKETVEDLRSEIFASRNADLISVSGAHDFLLMNGVVPTYHVECDPRAHKADNIDIVHARVKYLIGSGCHPALLDKLEGADVALWHIATPEHMKRFAQETNEPLNIVISGGGSVGLRSISLLYTLGYRDFSIYGMDCSFADDGTKWAGRHYGKQEEAVKATVNGRTFITSLTLLSYATDFIEMAQRVQIDCRLMGDGLLQAMCAQHAEEAAKLHAA